MHIYALLHFYHIGFQLWHLHHSGSGRRVTNILTILLWSWGSRGGKDHDVVQGQSHDLSWRSRTPGIPSKCSWAAPSRLDCWPAQRNTLLRFLHTFWATPPLPRGLLERKSLFMFVVLGGQQQCHKLNETQEFMAFHCQRRRIPVPCHH